MINGKCPNCGNEFNMDKWEGGVIGGDTVLTCQNCNVIYPAVLATPVSASPQFDLSGIEHDENDDAATINYRDGNKSVSIDISTHPDHMIFIELYVGMGGIDSEDDMCAQAVISKRAGFLLYQALGKILSKHNA